MAALLRPDGRQRGQDHRGEHPQRVGGAVEIPVSHVILPLVSQDISQCYILLKKESQENMGGSLILTNL